MCFPFRTSQNSELHHGDDLQSDFSVPQTDYDPDHSFVDVLTFDMDDIVLLHLKPRYMTFRQYTQDIGVCDLIRRHFVDRVARISNNAVSIT
jgi:hypothetical protein